MLKFQGSRVIAITLITILFFLGSIYFCVHLFTKEESTIHRVGSEAGRIDDELISIDYLSGVTGKLFKGEKIRQFQGSIIFKHMDKAKLRKATSAGKKNNVQHVNTACENWGVITTINEPTEAVINLAKLGNWCVVVVGDRKTPDPYTIPEQLKDMIVFLDVKDQENLLNSKETVYQDLLGLTPWDHFGRKNIGFIFAIQRGAKLIFDFDDDNVIDPTFDKLEVPSDGYSLETECDVFNHHGSMGAPTTPNWPRGFPLDRIKASCGAIFKPHGTQKCSIFQSLANLEPDVDAIYRLTQPSPFSFLPQGGNVIGKSALIIPSRTLVPYNAQATLIKEEVFWSLLLPISVHGRVSDIWRSYFSQPLMWNIGRRLAFMAPMVNQYRNAHNYLRDFQAENDLYYKSGSLVKFLVNWSIDVTLSSETTLPTLMETLFIELYERDYIRLADVRYCQVWLSALVNIGYPFPDIKPLTLTKNHSTTCLEHVMAPFPDVVLCINNNYYQGQKYDQLLMDFYSPLFPAGIFILRPSASKEQLNSIERVNGIFYYHCDNHNGGWQAYVCLARLMKLLIATEVHVKGFFYINDDVVWSYAKISRLNLDHVWFPQSTGDVIDVDHSPKHWLWPVSIKSVLNFKKRFPQTFQALGKMFGSNKIKGRVMADVFYTPQRFAASFIRYAEEFFFTKVIHEIAVINIYTLVLAFEDCANCWDDLHVLSLWDDERNYFNDSVVRYLRNTTSPLHCVHPLKLSSDTESQMVLLKEFFCDQIF